MSVFGKTYLDVSPSDEGLQDNEFKQSKLISVDPEGDVYLLLDHMELQVSSKALSLASKVFKVMFHGNFREGSTLAEDKTCRIPLPDDDPSILHALTILLHHRPSDIPYKADAGFIQAITVAADKYACTEAISYWAKVKLLDILDLPSHTPSEDAIGFFMAYVFDFHELFRTISKRLILSQSRLLLTTEFHYPTWGLDEVVRGILSEGLLATLSYHEKLTKNEILDNLEGVMTSTLSKRIGGSVDPAMVIARGSTQAEAKSHDPFQLSECDCCNVTIFLWALQKAGLWPISKAYRDETLGTLLEKLKGFATPESHQVNKECRDCNHKFDKRVAAIASWAYPAIDGLCLDCVKHHREGMARSYTCRISHQGYAGISVQGL